MKGCWLSQRDGKDVCNEKHREGPMESKGYSQSPGDFEQSSWPSLQDSSRGGKKGWVRGPNSHWSRHLFHGMTDFHQFLLLIDLEFVLILLISLISPLSLLSVSPLSFSSTDIGNLPMALSAFDDAWFRHLQYSLWPQGDFKFPKPFCLKLT